MFLRKSDTCLNCGTYTGKSNYCHHCGQQNTDKKISVGQIFRDFFGDYFTFDSKFFRSLFPLILKPGFLTNEYINGRRASYILPLRLYLFTTFLFFLLLALNTRHSQDIVSIQPDGTKAEFNRDSLTQLLDDYPREVPAEIRQRILQEFESAKVREPQPSKIEDDHSSFSQMINSKANVLNNMGEEGKALFWKEAINQIPKLFFLLLPLFAALLKLLFLRHQKLYIEHLVFALHVHTFIFIYLLMMLFFPNIYIFWLTVAGINLHLFLSLKNVYRQSIIKTFFKMGILLVLYFLLMIPALLLLLVLTIFSL